MSSAIDFAAMCYKNDCTGKLEISADTAKNNQMKCLERTDSQGVGSGGLLEEGSITKHCPLQGKSPTTSSCS